MNGYMNPYQIQNPYLRQNTMPINKVVDSVEMVKTADIPMDGNFYYFPKADGSVVYGKRWLPNCTTEVVPYLAQIGVQNDLTSVSSNETLKCENGANLEATDLLQRLESIENKLESLISVKKPTAKAVKENE